MSFLCIDIFGKIIKICGSKLLSFHQSKLIFLIASLSIHWSLAHNTSIVWPCENRTPNHSNKSSAVRIFYFGINGKTVQCEDGHTIHPANICPMGFTNRVLAAHLLFLKFVFPKYDELLFGSLRLRIYLFHARMWKWRIVVVMFKKRVENLLLGK